MGFTVGSRPAWLAHRVLGHGRGAPSPVFEIHGGGLDLVFPHHENELAQSSALDHEFARIWTHNGILRFTDEKMSKSLGNVVTMDEALDQRGRETLLLMFLGAHWRKPMDFSEETLQQAAARPKASARSSEIPPSRSRKASGTGSWPRSTTISTRRRRSRSCTDGATTIWCAAASSSSGSARLQSRRRRRRRWSISPVAGSRRARIATSARRIASAARSSPRAGSSGTQTTGSGSSLTTEQVYGRNARELLRGPRGVRSSGPPSALTAEPWLKEQNGIRVQVRPERELTEAIGSRDHQGVLARCEPYRYADAYELAATERALLVCLDQVTDPHNLGAVIRSAEGAGATGVVVPAHGAA